MKRCEQSAAAKIWADSIVIQRLRPDGSVQLEGLINRETVLKWKGRGFKSLYRCSETVFTCFLSAFQQNSD